MTTNTVEKDTSNLSKVANEDWPILGELSSNKRFVVRHKKSTANIEDLSAGLKNLSEVEDEMVSKQNQIDENHLEQAQHVAPVTTQEHVTIAAPVEKVTYVQETQKVPEVAPSITQPQTQNATSAPVTRTPVVETQESQVNVGFKDNEKPSTRAQTYAQFNALFKLAALGFAHLYVKKTTRLLNPLRFVADNFTKVFAALLHLAIPFLMTWYLTKKVDFISSQLAQQTPLMSIIFTIVFYFACMFIWISLQALGSGIFAVIKRTVEDVARVGQEKN